MYDGILHNTTKIKIILWLKGIDRIKAIKENIEIVIIIKKWLQA